MSQDNRKKIVRANGVRSNAKKKNGHKKQPIYQGKHRRRVERNRRCWYVEVDKEAAVTFAVMLKGIGCSDEEITDEEIRNALGMIFKDFANRDADAKMMLFVESWMRKLEEWKVEYLTRIKEQEGKIAELERYFQLVKTNKYVRFKINDIWYEFDRSPVSQSEKIISH